MGITHQKKILVVDDAIENLTLLEALLNEMNFGTILCGSGEEALKRVEEEIPDLALLDISMPGMSGFELCTRFKQDVRMEEVPIIFISALSETLDKVKAFGLGGVDYVGKPFEPLELKARITAHINIVSLKKQMEEYSNALEEKVQMQIKEISDSQISTIIAMAELSESRDECTGAHLARIGVFSKLLADQAIADGISEALSIKNFANNINYASALHDIGKVAVPDTILNKPGKLTPSEFEQIKTHCVIGADVLKKVIAKHPANEFVVMGEQIARYHHEKWNGKGYPYGLEGEAIPFAARIVAVADVYDAMRSKRQYKPAFSHEEASQEIEAGSGTHFDPTIVELFGQVKDRFAEAAFDIEPTEA